MIGGIRDEEDTQGQPGEGPALGQMWAQAHRRLQQELLPSLRTQTGWSTLAHGIKSGHGFDTESEHKNEHSFSNNGTKYLNQQ